MSRFQFHSSRYLDFSLRSTELVCNYMASWFVYPISLIITDDPKATANFNLQLANIHDIHCIYVASNAFAWTSSKNDWNA